MHVRKYGKGMGVYVSISSYLYRCTLGMRLARVPGRFGRSDGSRKDGVLRLVGYCVETVVVVMVAARSRVR